MYVEVTRESLYIDFSGKCLLEKKRKSCIYQSKDNMIMHGLNYYVSRWDEGEIKTKIRASKENKW